VPARYQFETRIGETEISQLSRALDSALDRSVIIERFRAELLDDATERRLYAIAQGGGPFMQRALSYDRQDKVAVFEAPAGRSLSEGDLAPSPRQLVRLMMGLGLAVAPLHEAGAAHGALGVNTIVIDDDINPTVLASGLGRLPTGASPGRDVADVFGIMGNFAACAATTDGIVDALAPALSRSERAALLAGAAPATGWDLYSFAEALEIALLKARRRG
jgi:hypothetical protein